MPRYYEFEVSLIGIKPKIFRRFVLPTSHTFEDLHEAIQNACGWEYAHLHSFQDPKGNEFAVGSEVDTDMGWGPKVPKDKRVKLYSYFGPNGDMNKHCTYLYDFGDSWEHDVKLVRIFESEERFERRLLDGARSFPPEDCGGVWGYEECLEAVTAKKKSKDMKERLEWLGDWKPEAFDLEEVRAEFDQ